METGLTGLNEIEIKGAPDKVGHRRRAVAARRPTASW